MKIEKYYVPYMDFEAINLRREKTLQLILWIQQSKLRS